MNRKELEKKRAGLYAQLTALNTRGAAFTDAEKAQWDDLTRQIGEIDAQLARLDELGALAPPAAGTDETEETREAGTQTPEGPDDVHQRAADILEICDTFNLREQAAGYIRDPKMTVDQVRAAVLEHLKKTSAPVNLGRGSVGDEAIDKFSRAASDALLLRYGVNVADTNAARNAQPAEGAEELRGLKLIRLMDRCARLAGRDTRDWDDDRLMREMFTPDSAFLSIVDNTLRRSMLAGFNSADTTFQRWTSRGSMTDFKKTKRYRLSDAGDLLLIPQTGEFQFHEMKDSGVEAQLDTYGRTFGVTRQAIINDDLGVIVKIPQAYVQRTRRTINKAVYATLVANGNLADGVALFDASSHKNYDGTGAFPSIISISEGRVAMRKQTSMSTLYEAGEAIDLVPSCIIAPVELETDLAVLLRSAQYPVASYGANVVNPLQNSLEIVTDPVLTDTAAWYLAADPAREAGIEVSYLNGRDMPTLEVQQSFETLGMRWRIYLDWGITVLDYRGLYKNKGAERPS